MPETPTIVGIVLVRNEDLYVKQAVSNIARFCDRIILCDHQSADTTPAILKMLGRRNSGRGISLAAASARIARVPEAADRNEHVGLRRGWG